MLILLISQKKLNDLMCQAGLTHFSLVKKKKKSDFLIPYVFRLHFVNK